MSSNPGLVNITDSQELSPIYHSTRTLHDETPTPLPQLVQQKKHDYNQMNHLYFI